MIKNKNLNVKELFKLGFKNQKLKNFQEAIKFYNRVIKIDPTVVFTYYNLGIIFEQLRDIRQAEIYYKEAIKVKPLFIHSYNNLGIMSQNQGQKENAIKYFKRIIEIDPKYYSGYSNLGLVYASLGMYDEALNNYLKTLEFDENNLVATKSIIFLLTYFKSDNNHSLVGLNNDLRQLQNKFILKDLLKSENLNYVLKNALKIVKNKSININDLSFFETQAYRRNPIDLNCESHHNVFNTSNIIPKFCFGCFKIQIEPQNVLDLIRLFFIFDDLNLSKNNQRKCMVEFRNQIPGLYKGMIYCSSLQEAKKISEDLKTKLKILLNVKVSIKRGCSEFYDVFPKFKIIDEKEKNFMNFNEDWKKIEENSAIKKNFNTIKFNNSISGLSISDFLIINQWLNYAKNINDLSYKNLDIEFLDSKFINQKMINQIEFRKKEFAK
jgi:tetratricopeptide (TPR) repeat protein